MKITNLFIVYSLILIVGLGLRVYQWEHYPFGFDQVQILKYAQQIASGDLVLLGPQSGPIQFFTGPFIYYLTALYWFITPSVYSLWLASTTLALVTGVVVCCLSYRYLEQWEAILYSTLWAVSPYLISLDRIAWNPNLSFLAASLVFFPLLGGLSRKYLTVWESIGIALGVFLGYQAHFSGLLLICLFMIVWLWRLRDQWLALLLAWVGFVASLLPTLIFDLGHQWLNLRGVLSLLSQPQLEAVSMSWGQSLANSLVVSLENIGKMLFWGNQFSLILLVGVTVLIGYIISVRSKQPLDWLPVGWIGVIAVAFSLYTKTKPEYYFLIAFPAVVYLVVRALGRLSLPLRIAVVTISALYSGWLTLSLFGANTALSLKSQRLASAYVTQKLNQEPIQAIVYDMKAIDQAGFRYLLSEVVLAQTGSSIHIEYPYMDGNKASYHAWNVGTWIDRRIERGKRYLETHTYILRMPAYVYLYEDVTQTQQLGAQAVYVIWSQGAVQGYFGLFNRFEFQASYPAIYAQLEQKDPDWTEVEVRTVKGFAGFDRDRVLMLMPFRSHPLETVTGYSSQITFLSID